MARRMLAALCALAALAALAVAAAAAPRRASGIPHSVRVALLARAHQIATRDGDARPFDIEAVRTTRPETVYVVAMRGHFHCNGCSHPRGAQIAPGTVITLEIDAKTMFATGFSLGNSYPDLDALGVPVRL